MYSAGTMLPLYVISICDLCLGKGKIEAWDEGEFVPQVVYMQVRGWKDVVGPRTKPADKDKVY